MIRIYRKIERVMDHPNSQSLHRYWNDLRNGRDAPSRSEIDPRRISGALDSMFILEALDDGQLRFRLAGTALCDLLGMEARGLTAEAAMAPGHEAQIVELGRRVLAAPGVGVMRIRAVDARGVDWSGELLLLPLRSELGELTRIIGCVGFDGANRRDRPAGPTRLRSLGVRMIPIEVEREIEDPLEALRAATTPVGGFADDGPKALGGFADDDSPFRRAGAPKPIEAPRPRLTAIDGNPSASRAPGRKDRPALRIVRDGEGD